jgi:cell division protein FtsX
MMRWILFVLVWLGSGVASFYMPWWIIAPAAFVCGSLLPCTPGKSLAIGVFAFGLLWFSGALYYHSLGEGIVTARTAALFGIAQPWLLLAACTFIGGLIGGLATLAGSYLRSIKSM